MRKIIMAAIVLTAFAAAADDPVTTIDQKDRAFVTREIHIRRGDTIRFHNADEFSHQVYTQSPDFAFDTDESPPGGNKDIRFPTAGHFQVHCHIHPKMRLDVDVD